jgi:hypothetical protein
MNSCPVSVGPSPMTVESSNHVYLAQIIDLHPDKIECSQ